MIRIDRADVSSRNPTGAAALAWADANRRGEGLIVLGKITGHFPTRVPDDWNVLECDERGRFVSLLTVDHHGRTIDKWTWWVSRGRWSRMYRGNIRA